MKKWLSAEAGLGNYILYLFQPMARGQTWWKEFFERRGISWRCEVSTRISSALTGRIPLKGRGAEWCLEHDHIKPYHMKPIFHSQPHTRSCLVYHRVCLCREVNATETRNKNTGIYLGLSGDGSNRNSIALCIIRTCKLKEKEIRGETHCLRSPVQDELNQGNSSVARKLVLLDWVFGSKDPGVTQGQGWRSLVE